MTCPRCQGLIVDDWGDVKCCNCGFRLTSAYVPPADERMNAEREQAAYKDSPTMILRRKLRKARRTHA
jgi:uncharacterized Zn finger protein (UPF0148 family)